MNSTTLRQRVRPPQPSNMSGFDNQEGFFQSTYYDQQQQQNSYAMDPQFGQDQQFQQFDYSQGYGGQDNQYGGAGGSNMYTGSIMTPSAQIPPTSSGGGGGTEEEDEPPLLEELGINFEHIVKKTVCVLHPLQASDPSIMQDTDLAGPLVIGLALGGALMLSGKIHFGYIYGIGLVGCVAMYCLLNLMSMTGVTVGVTVSVLGYCLLPMVMLSTASALLSLKGMVGLVLTGLTVLWCSSSAAKLFVSALALDKQQLLVAYPCALVYGVFALLTVF